MAEGTKRGRPPHGRDTYRTAIETGNFELLAQAFSRRVTMFTPVRPAPIEGRDNLLAFLGQLVPILQDFRFTDQLDSFDSRALIFKATIPATDTTEEVELQACDLLRFRRNDRIKEFVALARPIQALQALSAHGIGIPPGA